jgi:predicted transcriptional regulator of viral defense system
MLAIGRHFAQPYYFAYATAAAHYRFTSQSSTAIWIAATKHLPDRVVRDHRFRFISMVKRKFFGYKSIQVFDEWVNMSDPEKTVIDCADRPDLAGGIGEVTRIIARSARELNWDAFSAYARQFGSVATVQRFGYLAQAARVEIPGDCRQQLRSLLQKNSRSFLASPRKWGRTGHYDSQWQVIVNVPEREILSEI